jgi:hypothetical protein
MDQSPKTTKLGLASYLILPVQRIPRYRLLLTDLIKNTEKNHPDFKNLENSLQKICKVADEINSFIKKAEKGENLMKIADQFSGFDQISAPHRSFIKNLNFKLKEGGNLNIHLFNDIIVFSRNKSIFSGGGTKLFEYVQHFENGAILIFKSKKNDKIFKIQNNQKKLIFIADSKIKRDKFIILLHNVCKECCKNMGSLSSGGGGDLVGDEKDVNKIVNKKFEILEPKACVEEMWKGSVMLKYCKSAG